MNKTYLVDEAVEMKKSNLCMSMLDAEKFSANNVQKDDQKAELKLKLNKMRKRTKLLLKNHNWRKYFSEEDKLIEPTGRLANSLSLDESLSFDEEYNSIDEASSIFTDSSFVSTYEMFRGSNAEQQQQQSKLNLFNYFNSNNNYKTSPQALPNFTCSFSTSAPFSTSEMFQLVSNGSGNAEMSKTSAESSSAPKQSKFSFSLFFLNLKALF